MKKPALTCGICLMPIPPGIVNHEHPLAPTIDHIIPISRGGRKMAKSNHQIAHHMCNRQKGNRLQAEFTEEMWFGLTAGVFKELKRFMPEKMTRGYLTEARKRVGIMRLSVADADARDYVERRYTDNPIIRWENDGGLRL